MTAARATRLYAILARRSRVGVVFRRGPSKQVLLLRWELDTDRFEPGQWLAGRIYERRCDLSPGGRLLVYFAAKHKGEHPSYTVISRPPWLTALALFPKIDTWGGGGLFEGERHLRLNHSASHMELAPGSRLPRGFVLEHLGDHSGRGEDGPIEHQRRVRDGWVLTDAGHTDGYRSKAQTSWSLDPPRIYARAHPRSKRVRLEERLWGVHERGGAWYLQDAAVMVDDEEARLVERVDWVDWDRNGDLLHAKGGRIYRTKVDAKRASLAEPIEIADLRDHEFSRREAPIDARRW